MPKSEDEVELIRVRIKELWPDDDSFDKIFKDKSDDYLENWFADVGNFENVVGALYEMKDALLNGGIRLSGGEPGSITVDTGFAAFRFKVDDNGSLGVLSPGQLKVLPDGFEKFNAPFTVGNHLSQWAEKGGDLDSLLEILENAKDLDNVILIEGQRQMDQHQLMTQFNPGELLENIKIYMDDPSKGLDLPAPSSKFSQHITSKLPDIGEQLAKPAKQQRRGTFTSLSPRTSVTVEASPESAAEDIVRMLKVGGGNVECFKNNDSPDQAYYMKFGTNIGKQIRNEMLNNELLKSQVRETEFYGAKSDMYLKIKPGSLLAEKVERFKIDQYKPPKVDAAREAVTTAPKTLSVEESVTPEDMGKEVADGLKTAAEEMKNTTPPPTQKKGGLRGNQTRATREQKEFTKYVFAVAKASLETAEEINELCGKGGLSFANLQDKLDNLNGKIDNIEKENTSFKTNPVRDVIKSFTKPLAKQLLKDQKKTSDRGLKA